VDRRGVLPADDADYDCLARVAAFAPNLEMAEAGIQGVAEGRGGLRRPAEGQRALIPSLADTLFRRGEYDQGRFKGAEPVVCSSGSSGRLNP
jgi:hypothetical protein